ncbi:MAG: formate/nitrite transporter family protein [Clostridia bacterium]|nr:formate/nitrite transporter family protein [Clostridia bacterium]
MKSYLTPSEILDCALQSGEKKAKMPILAQLLLGFLAGAFIAFAAEGSNMAAFNLLAQPTTYGLGKALAGALFGTGLMLVIVVGGELFTGNTIMVAALFEKRISFGKLLQSWSVVYIGNLIGSVFIAYMMVRSGLFNSGENVLGGMTIKIAAYKVGLSFEQAFFLGIMCNWLVCLAVWMSYSAQDITGKLLAIFFPIWLFITSGFEHSIANMYYIPAGILAMSNEKWVAAAMNHGMTIENLTNMNWKAFAINNLVPVTLGNIVGGSIFVAGAYWLTYKKILK